MEGLFYAKIFLHMPFSMPNANALRPVQLSGGVR